MIVTRAVDFRRVFLAVDDTAGFFTLSVRGPAPLSCATRSLFPFDGFCSATFLLPDDGLIFFLVPAERAGFVALFAVCFLLPVSLTTALTVLFRLRTLVALRFTAACKALKASLI